MFNELRPLGFGAEGHPGVSVSRKIDEIKRVLDAIKIDRLRAAWRIAGKSQPFLAGKGVDEAGFPYVTSP